VVFALEGGYSLEGLAAGTAAVASAALGAGPPPLLAEDGRAQSLVAGFREALSPFWPILR
jgi:hypothetical protein